MNGKACEEKKPQQPMVVRISPTKRNAAIRLKFGFLPQEIVKRIAPCVDFSDHLVEVGA